MVNSVYICIVFDLCLWSYDRKQTMWVVGGTLYGELCLGFNGCVGIVCHAGVDSSILLCEIVDLDAASSQELHTTLTGDREKQGREENELNCEKVFPLDSFFYK